LSSPRRYPATATLVTAAGFNLHIARAARSPARHAGTLPTSRTMPEPQLAEIFWPIRRLACVMAGALT